MVFYPKYNPTIGVAANEVPQKEFEEEILNKNFVYTYDNGWDYQFYVPNSERVIYKISGGPMAGRSNFQTAFYQRVSKNIWQVNWLEETGTIVSLVLDINNKKITTLISFSQGHWENPEIAHGEKTKNLDQWRELAKIGNNTNRYMLTEQASIHTIFEGRGDLPELDMEHPTL